MGISDTIERGRATLLDRPFVVGAGVVVGLLVLDLLRRLYVGGLPVGQLGTFLWDGLVVGLGIGLAGIGLSMTYSILNFANFGHGDYVTAGAFMGWAVAWLVAGAGRGYGTVKLALLGSGLSTSELGVSVTNSPLAVVLGVLFAAVATIGLALFLDRVVYRPMRDQGGIPLLIASIGVALALRYSVVLVFGQRTRGTTAASLAPSWTIYGIAIDGHEVALVVIAAALMLGIHVVLQGTKLGKAMRAMADNEDLARVTGIPTERVVKWTWIIGAGLAGAAGFLLVLESGTLSYNMGWRLLLLIFAAVILGGIGSIYGAMIGGLLMGMATTVSLVWLPSEFSYVAAFSLMIAMLLFRPSGLFGGKTTA